MGNKTFLLILQPYENCSQKRELQVNFCIFKEIEILFEGLAVLDLMFFWKLTSLFLKMILIWTTMKYITNNLTGSAYELQNSSYSCNKRAFIPDVLDQKQPEKL